MSSPDGSNSDGASAPTQWVRPGQGLREAEVILRGGLLEGPLVVQDCVQKEGVIFLNVGAETKHMQAMFIGSKWNRRKRLSDEGAAHSALSDLRRYRNAVGRRHWQEFLEAMKNEEADPPAASQVNPVVDVLDFDQEPTSGDSQASEEQTEGTHAFSARVVRRYRATAFRMLPSEVVIDVPMPRGDVWKPRVLLPKDPQRAVYMEFTEANLRSLTAMLRLGAEEEAEEKPFRPGVAKKRDRTKKPRPEETEDNPEGDL